MEPVALYPGLKEKSVYVTGGATGIGAAIVASFAAQGARVHFIDIDEAAGAAHADMTNAGAKGETTFEVLDACDFGALKKSIHRFAGDDGLDTLVNNVANDARHDFADVTPESWRKCHDINLGAAFFAAQAAAATMRGRGGSIINIGSINAIFGPVGMPGYVSAKAGLIGLSKALANELGKENIRMNAVLPGWVATERQLAQWLTPEAEAGWANLTALSGRITAGDIANCVLFLASDASRMITGQQFVVDAGRI